MLMGERVKKVCLTFFITQNSWPDLRIAKLSFFGSFCTVKLIIVEMQGEGMT
jgi:hypothetical protein